ncbi:MAG: CDP-glucose 4,6-dehydratase [Rhodospirillaceae bacterium]|nr:CDP-glucose 4,6-dehydratase [Rhodospirillaceae bacterium]
MSLRTDVSARPASGFWAGKRVLVTGHTGFKGAWLAFWLARLGARVTAIALPPSTTPNLFDLLKLSGSIESQLVDIRDFAKTSAIIKSAKPEIVLHLAAQALVRTSYQSPLETFATNIMGTAHILEVLRECNNTRVAVMVTTDKVYRNLEHGVPYVETDPLGGHDPYSSSKAACEHVIASYRDSFLAEQGIAVASARAGNVIGGGDWSPDRLIPDAVKAWTQGATLSVRRPNAVRPWQYVLEPLSAYLVLAELLWTNPELAGPYNFGPATTEAATVRDVIALAQDVWGRADVEWGGGNDGPHEAGLLTLDAAKAAERLGIVPQLGLKESVRRTLRWYRAFADGADPVELCLGDIDALSRATASAA